MDNNDSSVYRWMKLEYGQILIKRRSNLKRLQAGALPVQRPARAATNGNGQSALFHAGSPATTSPTEDATRTASAGDIETALDRVIEANFDARVLGEEFLRFAQQPKCAAPG